MATPPDFSVGQVLTAANMNAVGMWKIGSASVSGATSFFLDSCFSSNYDVYKIVYRSSPSGGAADITMKLRTGAGDDNNSIYSYARFYGYSSGGSVLLNAGESGTSVYVGTQFGQGGSISMDLFNPNQAQLTSFMSQANAFNNASPFAFNNTSTGTINSTTVYTGIKLLSAANMTGTLTVYGYRN